MPQADRASDGGFGRAVGVVLTAILVVAVAVASAVYLVRAGRGAERGPAAAAAQGPSAPGQPGPVLPTAAAKAPAPTAAGVAAVLRAALADHRLGPRVAARVVDVASGATLLDHRGTAPTTPASTTKVLTATALLQTVPADFRFATRVVSGHVPGEVVLVGGGDPTLSAAAAGRPTSYDGAARIGDLAAAVKRSGVGTVRRVLVDDGRFAGPTTASGWDSDAVSGGFTAPVLPLMLDGGRTRPTTGYSQRSSQPDIAAGKALAAALGSSRATVVRGSATPKARILGTVESAPISQITADMLAVSDDVVAELLARQVAVATKSQPSFAGAAAAIRGTLAKLGVPSAGVELHDGSGLSRQDAISPAALTAALRAAAAPAHQRLAPVLAALPVSGYVGTLADRYRTGAARSGAGLVHAKTGTLSSVSTLAGVAQDTTGRLLAFAFMSDSVPAGGTLAAEAALDEAATRLTGCGCRQ